MICIENYFIPYLHGTHYVIYRGKDVELCNNRAVDIYQPPRMSYSDEKYREGLKDDDSIM